MASMSPQYRPEPWFKEVLELTTPRHLIIREVSTGRFIVCAPHAQEDAEYVLSTVRNPDEPKLYTDIGRAIQSAKALSGVCRFHVELSSSVEETNSNS